MLGACGITVKKTGVAKIRMHPIFPGLVGMQRFGVHNNNLGNGCRALVERVFLRETPMGLQPPPQCLADASKTLEEFKQRIVNAAGVHRRLSAHKFVSMYTGRRQTVYARAAESLEKTPIHVGDFRVGPAFVKCEKINFTAKGDPAPRLIQPRNPRYNVEVGRYLKPLEHVLYEGIAKVFGDPTVMKGYNAREVGCILRAKWDSFRDPVAIGLDASRFDQHVRIPILQWEHSVYEACFVGAERDHLRWLLRGQLVNRGTVRTTDGRISYTVHGSRMSGDMNTALGNCLIMCALVHLLAKTRGVRIKLANNGDDCVVFCERREAQRLVGTLPQFFTDYGFTMKVEDPVDVFERLEFCQARPVKVRGSWLMVRDPRICCSKDGVCVNSTYASGRAARLWLGAVGDCGAALSPGVPVLQQYYQAFTRHGERGKEQAVVTETGMYHLSKGLTAEVLEVDDDARVSFWLAFGITPTHQRELEGSMGAVEFEVPKTPCMRVIPPRGNLRI